MNGTRDSLRELADLRVALASRPAKADILICPPATLLSRAFASVAHAFELGGQNCHAEVSGAFTGDVSAEMLRDAGATAVIVGHSERRRYQHETDADVAGKTRAAWRAGLLAIVCIGETQQQHDAGHMLDVCATQISGSLPEGVNASNTAVAYEPVWAIGTGRTPTSADIAQVHGHIRERLVARFGPEGQAVRILYGGSVKPSNAAEFLALANVGGALVGGASLKAAEFLAIIAGAAVT